MNDQHYDALVLVLSSLGDNAFKPHRPHAPRELERNGFTSAKMHAFYAECVERGQAIRDGELFRFVEDVMRRLHAPPRSTTTSQHASEHSATVSLEEVVRKLYLYLRGSSFVFDDVGDWHQAAGRAESPFRTRKHARELVDAAISKEWLKRQDGGYAFARVSGIWRTELERLQPRAGVDCSKIAEERDAALRRVAELEAALRGMCKELSG